MATYFVDKESVSVKKYPYLLDTIKREGGTCHDSPDYLVVHRLTKKEGFTKVFSDWGCTYTEVE